MDIKTELETYLGEGKVSLDKELSPYFTIRIPTKAEYFFEAYSKDDWINVFKTVDRLDMPLFILGGGSNIVFTKDRIEGLVVKNLYQKKELLEETEDEINLLVSSGYPVSRLAKETSDLGYSGFEYHLGLPGTLGGAVYMNSKWTHPLSYIGDNLLIAYLLDQRGNIREVPKEYFNFSYDYSILQNTKEFFLEGIFRLKKDDPLAIKHRALEAIQYRKETQPFGVSTCGCFFRNISEVDKKRLGLKTSSAGYLIDQSGLKNMQIGDFIISDKHANFIINKGKGTSEDLKKLLDIIKSKVKEKFGIELKEEVVLV